jgi:hypothetical protein
MNERDKELALQAGFVAYELEDHTESGYDIRYSRYADLIRADEREAYAKFLERANLGNLQPDLALHCGLLINALVAEIRARENT